MLLLAIVEFGLVIFPEMFVLIALSSVILLAIMLILMLNIKE